MATSPSDEALASRIAQEIERYWRSRGYPDVRATVQRIATSCGEGAYGIKSNLVNGLPPGFRGF